MTLRLKSNRSLSFRMSSAGCVDLARESAFNADVLPEATSATIDKDGTSSQYYKSMFFVNSSSMSRLLCM